MRTVPSSTGFKYPEHTATVGSRGVSKSPSVPATSLIPVEHVGTTNASPSERPIRPEVCESIGGLYRLAQITVVTRGIE